ncbi:MAG: prolyl oligopeptidase family serine peptidase [Candidatus Binatia bacterium]
MTIPARIRFALCVVALCCGGAGAQVIPETAPELPVASREVPAGSDTAAPAGAVLPTAKTVDGAIGDWIGDSPRFGGAAIYSRGEYVYQDHLSDAFGADDGGDAERLGLLAPATGAEPRTYRLDPAVPYAQDELGLPDVGPFRGAERYGDAEHQDHADIAEVRVAADAADVHLLVRTTSMTAAGQTAVLLLADTLPVDPVYAVPFASGLTTARADVAILLAGNQGWVADLGGGGITELAAGSVVTNPAGYDNAVEAVLPRSLLEGPGGVLEIALAAGGLGPLDVDQIATLADLGVGARVANVAFRPNERVRIFWEMQQALALGAGSIDPFFAAIDLAKLTTGATETWVPGPGYHDRIFLSSEAISDEAREQSHPQGVFQHYGVYLPAAYDPDAAAPLQFWLHFRGGLAHTPATVAPRIMQDYGEDVGTIVVSPSGRGTSRWYVGKGHADFLEVWDDVHATFTIDANRVYVSGHSMGGFGSYLMTVLYPDRFAAGMPVAGPVTQGAWTGLDFEGCDDLAYEDGEDVNTPCYVSVNGGRGRDQHTRRMLENLRHVPLGIFQGALDELVPVSGVTRQVEELVRLGYRHRYYLFPTYEHYSHPVVDEWEEGVRYLHGFVRDPDPPRVTYLRDMRFERAVEEVQSDGDPLSFDFDRAYWMSELEPVDPEDGVARFDGWSLRRYDVGGSFLEAGGPASEGQTGPYVMTGLGRDPFVLDLLNLFYLTLAGAAEVRVDLERMGVDTATDVFGRIETEHPLTLRLDGAWVSAPTVAPPLPTSFSGGLLTIELPAGSTDIWIRP